MSNSRQSPRADCLRRLLATGCAFLIFALGLLAASPALHGQLHHDATLPTEDGCAIVLFAGGVAVPLAVVAVPPSPPEWRAQVQVVSTEISLDSPRYLLQPERGPPVA
ncbi:MAG: hypothetical protein EXS32_09890 [Opitutus sp.]|nr:hypothetical protein [Opitutus sp.]